MTNDLREKAASLELADRSLSGQILIVSKPCGRPPISTECAPIPVGADGGFAEAKHVLALFRLRGRRRDNDICPAMVRVCPALASDRKHYPVTVR